MNNLSVDYFTKTIGQKKKNKGFVTNLHLGENKYLSYPEVAPTQEEAEEIAAQNAVEKIKESQGNNTAGRRVVVCNDNSLRIQISR